MGGVHIPFHIDYLPANMGWGWGLVHSTVYYRCKNKRSPPQLLKTLWHAGVINTMNLQGNRSLSASRSTVMPFRLSLTKPQADPTKRGCDCKWKCIPQQLCLPSFTQMSCFLTRSAHLLTRKLLHFLDSRLAMCTKYVWLLLTSSSGCFSTSLCCFTRSCVHVSLKISSSPRAIFTSLCCDKFKEHSEGPCALHTLLGFYENMIYRFKCGTYWQRQAGDV